MARTYIQHIFNGGWATDFGPSAVGIGAGDNGILQIPFLVDADDVLYELDGGPRKAPGTTKLNSSALESGAAITGLYDYWRQGGGGSPTQKRVVHVGTKIYKDDADGNFTEIFSGLESGAIPSYATFDDILIISSDSTADVPKSWDQTTAQDLAGSPPNFSFSVKHKNFMFAAGDPSNPSRLYYSVQLNPEDWTGMGSGTIDIDPGDGDQITGLVSHKDQLFVFKGPYKGSIHRIAGSSGADFARSTFIEGIGAVWHNTIFKFGDDVGFMWSDGTIRTLSAVERFGDFTEAAISRPIQSYLEQNLNFSNLRKVWAVTHDCKGVTYFAIPTAGSSTNNVILAWDFRFTPARWSKLPSFSAASVAQVVDTDSSCVIMLGGQDGFIRKWNNPTRSIDGTTALSYKVTTPFFDYGVSERLKTIEYGSIGVQPRNDGNITFGHTRDDNAEQTRTVAQGGTDVLAPADANQFTLGTSALGGARFVDRFFELEEGGEFRTIQYKFTNSVNNEDVEIHGFGVGLTPGAESTE